MSLYRQPRRRSLHAAVAALAAGLLAGALIGFAIGKSSADQESLAEQVAELRDEARPIGAALELVSLEYEEAVGEGGRVVAATEYEAARSDVDRATASFEAIAEDLTVLEPASARRLRAGLARLRRDVEGRANPERIDADTAFLEAALGKLAGTP